MIVKELPAIAIITQIIIVRNGSLTPSISKIATVYISKVKIMLRIVQIVENASWCLWWFAFDLQNDFRGPMAKLVTTGSIHEAGYDKINSINFLFTPVE